MESKSFKIWDKNNSVPRKERKIIISVRRDRIVFPKETCKAINLKEGMELTFLQATDNPQLWFLVKSGTEGMRVCQEKNGTMHVKAATMCAELFRLSGSLLMMLLRQELPGSDLLASPDRLQCHPQSQM